MNVFKVRNVFRFRAGLRKCQPTAGPVGKTKRIRFEVFMVMKIHNIVLWDITMCSLADGCHVSKENATSICRIQVNQTGKVACYP